MPSESGRPYLSETIDYDSDIAPYQFIKIYAGVGSGKNYFVDNLVKGYVFKHADGSLIEKKYVLLFTSRRSKANEQLNLEKVKYDKTIGAFDQWEYYFDDDACCEYEKSETRVLPDLGGFCSREIKLRSCSCTNAQAEIACSEFIPAEPYTHPWERFDFIVIDEVHALLADANYQSAPFYIQRLLEEIKLRAPACKVIVMTGSPEIIKDYPLLEDYHLIDRMDVCDNLAPSKVTFISHKKSEAILGQCLTENKKVVCFFNRIDEITKMAKQFSAGGNRPAVPSFSNEEKRRRLKRENRALAEAMQRAEASLATHCILPEDVILFLTNAKNKEGINIKNPDVKAMLVHAHAEVDIKQMAGRVRNGLDDLYIVVDSTPFDDHDLAGELEFTINSNLLETVNAHFEKLVEEVQYNFREHHTIFSKQMLSDYVSFVHKKFPYIRFDYFTEKFVFYHQRQLSKEYYDTQTQLFTTHRADQTLNNLAAAWYPNAQCVVEYCPHDQYQSLVDQFIEEHNLLGRRLNREQEKQIFEILQKLTNSTQEQLAYLLREYGYRKKREGKTSYGCWSITRLF